MQTSCEALQGWKRQDNLCPSIEGKRFTTLLVLPCSPLGSNNKTPPAQIPAKQRRGWGGVGGSWQRHIQKKFLSLLDNGCSLVLRKLGWIMKDIYQTLEKFQHWKKFTIIYQLLEATMYFSLCDMETHVQWVGGFLVQHQTHTVLPVIGFSWRIQDRALKIIKHLKSRHKNHSKWYLNPTMTTEAPVSDNLTCGITLWWRQ